MYLVSVYFDDKSNKIISDYINKIAQKTGNTFMTDNHVPPHLTIMSVEAREEEKLTEVMEQLERSLTKGQIQLVSVGVLLPYVLYAAPVLNLYLEDTDVKDLYLNGLEGSESYETARDTIRTSIDEEIPVAYLMLKHRDKEFDFFQWHWFLVNGYEETADTFKIKAATYGKAHWMDLGRLWDTGYDHKGGIVTFHFK